VLQIQWIFRLSTIVKISERVVLPQTVFIK